MTTETLLEVEDLSTSFFVDDGTVHAVDEVSFTVPRGEVFGIVGESGSGKSATALSVLDLIKPPGRITDGAVRLHSADLATKVSNYTPAAVDGDAVDLRELPQNLRDYVKGRKISMVFQDPERSFNKSLTVGEQIAEAVEVNRRSDMSDAIQSDRYGFLDYAQDLLLPTRSYVHEESYERAIELLELVGISDPELRVDEYPHQFSGGMLQRAMIAQALAGDPDLLIADEPTSALDVTIQSQILELLDELRTEVDMSVILISHNLGVIARMCNEVGVMYAGQIVERGDLEDIFHDSVHPYTRGLISAIPDVEGSAGRLEPIEGQVPDLTDLSSECRFIDRCPKSMDVCREQPPELQVDDDHSTKCYLADHESEAEHAEQIDAPLGDDTRVQTDD
jgi:peptide/nickel transport system ATP-binding protein